MVADAADAIVVAPATARWLGAMANGIASDTVVAACLATSAPVVFAPAMDGDMWTHPATRANVARLTDDFGYRLVAPETSARSPRASPASAAWPSSRRSSTRSSRPSARGRSASRTRPRGRRVSGNLVSLTSRAATSS